MGSGVLTKAFQAALPPAVLNTLESSKAQTTANTAALTNYAARAWRISQWWRSPPQCKRAMRSDGTYIKPKLLIAYSDTGGGHKSAAASICSAIEHLAPGEFEIKLVDVIEEYSMWASNRTYSFFTSQASYSPEA